MIDQQSISSHHALVCINDEKWETEDFTVTVTDSSSNGTYVNHVRIGKGVPHALHSNDLVHLYLPKDGSKSTQLLELAFRLTVHEDGTTKAARAARARRKPPLPLATAPAAPSARKAGQNGSGSTLKHTESGGVSGGGEKHTTPGKGGNGDRSAVDAAESAGRLDASPGFGLTSEGQQAHWTHNAGAAGAEGPENRGPDVPESSSLVGSRGSTTGEIAGDLSSYQKLLKQNERYKSQVQNLSARGTELTSQVTKLEEANLDLEKQLAAAKEHSDESIAAAVAEAEDAKRNAEERATEAERKAQAAAVVQEGREKTAEAGEQRRKIQERTLQEKEGMVQGLQGKVEELERRLAEKGTQLVQMNKAKTSVESEFQTEQNKAEGLQRQLDKVCSNSGGKPATAFQALTNRVSTKGITSARDADICSLTFLRRPERFGKRSRLNKRVAANSSKTSRVLAEPSVRRRKR